MEPFEPDRYQLAENLHEPKRQGGSLPPRQRNIMDYAALNSGRAAADAACLSAYSLRVFGAYLVGPLDPGLPLKFQNTICELPVTGLPRR